MIDHSTLPSAVSKLCEALDRSGLNLAGVADPQRYDAAARSGPRLRELHPGGRSVIVFASGGPSLWQGLEADIRANPPALTEEAHPLDAYVRRRVAEADAEIAHYQRRWFFAAAETDVFLDFRLLAMFAGLGSRSRLGLLIHPIYGPWLGLRAACALDLQLPSSAEVEDLCEGCPAPCVTACPGGALRSGSWDVDRCTQFHAESDVCALTCHARLACPMGKEHRYPEREITYHYCRAVGRVQLRTIANAPDGHEGSGPF